MNYDDIDHIIVLSIIDGEHVFCQYHHEKIKECRELKLSGCATLTSKVIQDIGDFYIGPREIIFWLDVLKNDRRIFVDEPELRFRIKTNRKQALDFVISSYSHLLPASYKKFTEMHSILFNGLIKLLKKNSDIDHTCQSVLSDLSLMDVLWLIYSTTYLQSLMALPGEYGPCVAMSKRDNAPYQHHSVMAVNIAALNEYSEKHDNNQIPGVRIYTSLDVGHLPTAQLFTINPLTGPSCLENEIKDLRDKPLMPLSSD